MAFRARDVDIFRPYPDEVPWELLAETGVDEQALASAVDVDFLRVAKHEGRIVGAYAIRPRSETCYELVTLIVARGYRHKGLGRWLLGHAVGLAETKGGREIVTSSAGADATAYRFLTRFGFEPVGEPTGEPSSVRATSRSRTEPVATGRSLLQGGDSAGGRLRLVLTPE